MAETRASLFTMAKSIYGNREMFAMGLSHTAPRSLQSSVEVIRSCKSFHSSRTDTINKPLLYRFGCLLVRLANGVSKDQLATEAPVIGDTPLRRYLQLNQRIVVLYICPETVDFQGSSEEIWCIPFG
jgi:hypothetical protein